MIPTIRDKAAPSPVVMPPEVRAKLEGQADSVADFAHATIEVSAGTPTERSAMVATWTKLAEQRTERWPASKSDAAIEGIWFCRQDDFLDVVGRWLKSDSRGLPEGLAMSPSPRAATLLLSSDTEQASNALHWLAPVHVQRAIPVLIERLDHPSDAVRSLSELRLRTWTKETMGADWDGYRLGRPTRQEGARLKALWRAWLAKR